MVASRSSLSRPDIVRAVTDLLGPGQVDTDETRLRESSVDRFRKYTAVHGIFDGPVPAAVVYPTSTDQVAQLLDLAQRERLAVVPRTGGTSTEGGLETIVEDSVVIDGSLMDRILAIDAESMMATVQCGVPLRVLEDQLREQGLTTGHSPQSKPIAQLGGLVATIDPAPPRDQRIFLVLKRRKEGGGHEGTLGSQLGGSSVDWIGLRPGIYDMVFRDRSGERAAVPPSVEILPGDPIEITVRDPGR